MENYFFNFCQNPESDRPIMVLDRAITEGVGSSFARELMALDMKQPINGIEIWINCQGGRVTEGYNIYNAILQTKTQVDTVNVGICASMGAVIHQAGAVRYAMDYAYFMFHDPYKEDSEELTENDRTALESVKNSLTKMICSKCKLSEEEMGALMLRDYWISSQEAKEKGFCDVIRKQKNLNIKNFREFENKLNIVNLLKISTMDKLLNFLKLTEMNEGEMLKAISNKIENEKAPLLSEIESLKTVLNSTSEQLEVFKKEQAEKELAIKTEKANTLVNSFAEKKAITEESKQAWVNLALSDFENAEKLLNSLPITMKAPDTLKDFVNQSQSSGENFSLVNFEKSKQS